MNLKGLGQPVQIESSRCSSSFVPALVYLQLSVITDAICWSPSPSTGIEVEESLFVYFSSGYGSTLLNSKIFVTRQIFL